MVNRNAIVFVFTAFILSSATGAAGEKNKPYRLESVDLKKRIIWGAEVRNPDGSGLAFGGQDQDADDGRPHTRILVDGKWKAIHRELRKRNPLQSFHAKASRLRQLVKRTEADARSLYFQGLPVAEEAPLRKKVVGSNLTLIASEIEKLDSALPKSEVKTIAGQVRFGRRHLALARKLLAATNMGSIPYVVTQLQRATIHLSLAAEAFDAEPPPRALDCGQPRKQGDSGKAAASSLVYDSKTKLYVLFGGDHLDYLTNDTWVFDPSKKRWMQRHPDGAPPPRANHQLQAMDGRVTLTGGYTYSSATGYVSGQYVDLNDGKWIYDIASNQWTPAKGNSAKLVPADTRVYRTGPFHPDYYLQGPKPNAAEFQAKLEKLPTNEWVATNPPFRPRLNRDWGTARIDPDRDIMLRWSGGHSAHGGTDVPHFHFATNHWELPQPVEFPLGQLYSNMSYPNGFNFNLRPWITGHTYQNYAYDPPSKTMVFAGRPRHFYVYDPDVGDWTARGKKPVSMQYNSSFYTMTLTATPLGAMCWDRNGRIHQYNHNAGEWRQLKLTGDKLRGAYVDNSTICYDSKRDRLLIIGTSGYKTPYDGQVWSVDIKSQEAKALSPAGMKQAHRFANIDKCCYVASHDLVLLGTYLRDSGAQTPTPAYDCASNRWVTLNLKYGTGKRYNQTTRAFPNARSDGMMFDAKRNLVWGTNTNCQVYVLRLAKSLDYEPLR